MSRTNGEVASIAYQPALTGLRALAAALVFLHHFYGQWFNTTPSAANEWLREGYIGVSIFFTLSGYLITRTYMDRYSSGRIGFGEYWFRRFSRVFPAYIALLFVKYAFMPASLVSGGQFLANVTLAQGFFASAMWTGIAPAWSLTIEECFYLVAPAVYLVLARAKSIVNRAGLLVAIGLGLWLTGTALHTFVGGDDFLSSPFNTQVYTIFGRFAEFGAGILAALLIHREGARKAPTWLKEIAFAGFFASIALTIYALHELRVAAGTYYGIVAPNGLFTYWILSAGTCLLIWSVLQGSPLARFTLGNRFVDYLGRISYAFYLVQDRFFMERVHALVKNYTPWSPADPWVSFIALNLLAAGVYQLIEKPTHAWLNDRYARAQARPKLKPEPAKA